LLGRIRGFDGHINALEWTGLDFPSASLRDLARHAAFGGQVAVLEWLKDPSILPDTVLDEVSAFLLLIMVTCKF
jgi:hypothetical protein